MMNRRHFMEHVAGAAALTVPSLHFLAGLKASAVELKKKSKSLVIFWMGGGPSHMDLWDLKPGTTNGGEFKTIKTAASGVEISEILPTIASQFKNLSIVRSLVTNEGSHERGTVLMNTGRAPNPISQFPHIGSVASSLLAAKDLALPGFIGVGGTAQGIGPGFLGMSFAPFTVQNAGQPPANIKAPTGLGGDAAMVEERLRRRQRLFYTVEDNFTSSSLPHVKSDDPKKEVEMREALGSTAQAHTATYKKGFDLTVSKLKDVFDISKESPKSIEAYGGRQNGFGMGCLLARKLVEQGVSTVEVDLGGWDNHGNIFNTLKMGNGPRLDKGMGTFVKELVERGKWQDTVVLWMGEFGRTPRINQGGGRDHWARCWSVVIGGGAIKGGQVYGATSADGMDVAKDACTLGDLFTTVYKGLGVDPSTKIRDNLGRPLEIAVGKPLAGLV
jgi:Protein of unknown function (DUF1501)